MNVQLLLLLALAGPFCAFTHASPTEIPTDLDVAGEGAVEDAVPDVTEAPKDLSIITGPPATEPAAAAEEVATEAAVVEEVATEAAVVEEVATEAAVVEEVVTEEAAVEVVTVAAAPPATEEAVVETEAPAAATEAPEALITDPPVVETAAPTEPAEVEVEATEAAKAEEGVENEVVVEDDTEEGLSSGQVVGIVIGALLAVVIVIAVVIAAVRRMGKYSSAKNKKPTKSVMVSPLRKKSSKQPERTKFWKF